MRCLRKSHSHTFLLQCHLLPLAPGVTPPRHTLAPRRCQGHLTAGTGTATPLSQARGQEASLRDVKNSGAWSHTLTERDRRIAVTALGVDWGALPHPSPAEQAPGRSSTLPPTQSQFRRHKVLTGVSGQNLRLSFLAESASFLADGGDVVIPYSFAALPNAEGFSVAVLKSLGAASSESLWTADLAPGPVEKWMAESLS